MTGNHSFKAVAKHLGRLLDGRRYLVSASLGLLIAPLISLGRTPQPPGTQEGRHSSSRRVLTASDITYVGAFRMPPNTDTAWAFGSLSGRLVNGQVHLFVAGNNTTNPHDQVYEIVDPGSGYTTDYTKAPRATLYANWGDIYHGRRISFDAATGTPLTLQYLLPGGFFWNDQTQLLYWTYRDGYNVSLRPDWGLGATSLGDPATGTSTAYGPWRAAARDADHRMFYGPWRCLYLFARPSDGSLMCGSTPQSGDSGSPFGPDAYGGAPWPTKTTPAGFRAPDLVLSTRSLEYYFMGAPNAPNHFDELGALHGAFRSFRRTNEQTLWEPGLEGLRANPALNKGIGSWGETDGTNGAIWLELANTRAVIFSAGLAGAVSQDPTDCVNASHTWYANAGVHPPIGACSHGCPPPVGSATGPVTTASFPAFIIYNPDDLASVEAGTIPDYSPNPTATIDLVTTYGLPKLGANGGVKTDGGFYFDPVRKYLFTVSQQADDSDGRYAVHAVIHVFAIHDTPTAVPTPVLTVPVSTPVPAAADRRLVPAPKTADSPGA